MRPRAGGAPVASVYSPRLRPGVPVSFPVPWSDLDSVTPADFTLHTVPGLLGDPAPFVRFMPGFGDSSLNFTLFCRIATYVDQYLAQHELRKRILARFRQEGVEIPFPQRDVHIIHQKRVTDEFAAPRPVSKSA